MAASCNCTLAYDCFLVAEFRGPGVHHNYEDSDSGYEVEGENKGKSFGVGGSRGRIIFLGDGTEVLTDSDDTEMFDNADEDKDLESQVSKTKTSNEKDESKDQAAPSAEAKPQTSTDSTTTEEKKQESTTGAVTKEDNLAVKKE